jgi:hypothetical protein
LGGLSGGELVVDPIDVVAACARHATSEAAERNFAFYTIVHLGICKDQSHPAIGTLRQSGKITLAANF